jgi:hypothetical protein
MDGVPQSISERDIVETGSGSHAENPRSGDDNVLEELVAEGMDEAVHDQNGLRQPWSNLPTSQPPLDFAA